MDAGSAEAIGKGLVTGVAINVRYRFKAVTGIVVYPSMAAQTVLGFRQIDPSGGFIFRVVYMQALALFAGEAGRF